MLQSSILQDKTDDGCFGNDDVRQQVLSKGSVLLLLLLLKLT